MQSTHIVPHIPANANIGQSLGNFKKNYRQVRACLPASATPPLKPFSAVTGTMQQ